MKVLIIGSGGREHAFAWKVAQSKQVDQVFVAPGNAGTALEARVKNVDISVQEIPELIRFARDHEIELTIVGPEMPLVAGIVDEFETAGLRCFGPHRDAAQLEGSKTFAKEFLARHAIPTAGFASFTDVHRAVDYVNQQSFPIVIKADGLAAGKGVIIAHDRETAINALQDMLTTDSFGAAGRRVVIEQFISGEEASYIVMVDGQHFLPMATSQDHKTRDDGDLGPNTGGMGAYSPAAIVTPSLQARIIRTIIEPTVKGLAEDGIPYVGFLYAGLIIDQQGNPFVLEYNCRFGDPETQPIMMRLKSDLVALCDAGLTGRLDKIEAEWDERVALGVVLAAEGYPGDYRKGDKIVGLPAAERADFKVFHAGTKRANGDIVTSGGRVLCAVALGKDVLHAKQKAYQSAQEITWPGRFMRTDIGYRALVNSQNT